jgi:hypothetical protein
LDIAVKSLIAHLQAKFTKPEVRTIDEYAGELSEDVKRVTALCPAIFVMFIDGRPSAFEKQYRIDLLIITRQRELDKKQNRISNLYLASRVAEYLKTTFLIPRTDGYPGRYEVMRDDLTATTLLNDNQLSIISLSVPMIDFHN